MKEKPRPDHLTQLTTFYDLSVSCNIFSKVEMHQFDANAYETIGNQKVNKISSMRMVYYSLSIFEYSIFYLLLRILWVIMGKLVLSVGSFRFCIFARVAGLFLAFVLAGCHVSFRGSSDIGRRGV